MLGGAAGGEGTGGEERLGPEWALERAKVSALYPLCMPPPPPSQLV